MRFFAAVWVVLACVVYSAAAYGQDSEPWIAPPAEDFPSFSVPGHDAAMGHLRDLYWLHYGPSGPLATIWDEWISGPSLWPAVGEGGQDRRRRWRRALLDRIMDDEGYVATHQHASIAHPLGWPFPFWKQGQGGWGWHFVTPPGLHVHWHHVQAQSQDEWLADGIEDNGIGEAGWQVTISEPRATFTAPPLDIDPFNAPFIQVRWRLNDVRGAAPYLDWTTDDAPEFSPERRMYFDAPEGSAIAHQVVPVYKHPAWKGRITGLRVGFGNTGAGGDAVIEAVFTTYDTRHTVNNPNFVEGSTNYFAWTHDRAFLRANFNRMRRAMRYAIREFKTEEFGVLTVDWVGHDGRSGHAFDDEGNRVLLYGRAIGNNYWDLMPFGHHDAYGTVYFYDALLKLADIEEAVRAHPGWNIPIGADAFEPEWLREHAAFMKRKFTETFWNPATGRYACSIDVDGVMYDYGYTFLNLEAIHYGLVPDAQAREIMDWITGRRIVDGDTATGGDIYHWRFGPRSTTKRNVEYYLWAWSDPASIPWGGQVQDGGGVLGWSYHDLMARLKVLGPDNAAQRLLEIMGWFGEVKAAGGYRAYYDGTRDGTLQGGGTAGGLGLDREFFESILVPQVMIDGFLGFRATVDGASIAPRLPSSWPSLTIDRIALHDCVLRVEATANQARIEITEGFGPMNDEPLLLHAGEGWRFADGGTEAWLNKVAGAQVVLVAVE